MGANQPNSQSSSALPCASCNVQAMEVHLGYIRQAVDDIKRDQKDGFEKVQSTQEGFDQRLQAVERAQAVQAVPAGWLDKGINALIAALVAAGFSFLMPHKS